MTGSLRDGEGHLEAERELRELLDAADMTDEEAEARDRRGRVRDAARRQELADDDSELAELEHRNLDRFLAGRERDDAVGLNSAMRHYLDDQQQAEE